MRRGPYTLFDPQSRYDTKGIQSRFVNNVSNPKSHTFIVRTSQNITKHQRLSTTSIRILQTNLHITHDFASSYHLVRPLAIPILLLEGRGFFSSYAPIGQMGNLQKRKRSSSSSTCTELLVTFQVRKCGPTIRGFEVVP